MNRVGGSGAATLVVLLTIGVLSACSSQSTDGATPVTPAATAPATEVAAKGLEAPWSVVLVGGSFLVSERDSGRIIEVLEDGSTREAGVIADAEGEGEGGLLGLALDRDDDGVDELYVYLTTMTDNRIQRVELQGEPGSLSLGGSETVIDGIPRARNHNGGRIAFGPDGMLYVGTGDAGRPDASQDPDSLGGKILRMTPDGDVPGDNPIDGSFVYSSGHRNVQGIAWAEDGTMFASEFGQNTWDELNVIEAGANYGWPVVEGDAGNPDFVDPVQQWSPGEASPSGIAVAGGILYIANLRGERLRSVDLDDLSVATDHLTGEYGRLRDVIPAPGGGLFVLTNNTDGRGDPVEGDDRLVRVVAGE
ncbi:PQQ-dependent sugar dehydrogenase [Microbacterium lacus]|uniref:PQQ-dependent sugar dehydrogenase n=1 Tax=Microbacterium lacus TaxID=415217 RepID=UPI00385109EF